MEEINSHIVSRLKWDTTFDHKEEAYKLQERLSSWSKIVLPREIASVFNELCPAEQSWRIQSLEIDLGTCDLNDLEYDLSTKIRRQLHEKIADLILNQNSQNKNTIEVYDKEKSILESLIAFLSEGFFPWNYQNKDASINQLMTEQLQNSLPEIIAFIKKYGARNEHVRKRIAWQFNERNTTQIIKALEPNNSSTIIEFTSILTKIQTKETIIQTSLSSFKKNLCYWILNYLLLERGTLFNKHAFMKSSIQQMANHYNIAYSELIQLIEQTIIKLSEKTKENSDFILILRILTKEFETEKQSNYSPIAIPDYWSVLDKQLRNSTERKSTSQKNKLNELIESLHNENKTKFKALIKGLGTSETFWNSLIPDLNETTLQLIFATLEATNTSMCAATIIYLKKLSDTLKLKTNHTILWKTGFVFLLKNESASTTAFLLFCIKELSKQNHVDTEQLLELFTSAKIPTAIKNTKALAIYSNLSEVYCTEINHKNSNFTAIHFKSLLEKLGKQLLSSSAKNELFISLQRSFTINIALHPVTAFDVMLSYPNKELLKKVLPLVLNRELIRLLIKHSNFEKSKLILTIQEVYADLNPIEKFDLPEDLIKEELLKFGLEELLIHPAHNISQFLETVLLQLLDQVANAKRIDFKHFVAKLLMAKKINFYHVSISLRFLEKNIMTIHSIPVIEQVNLLLKTSQKAQATLTKLLKNNFDDSKFILLRKQDRKESQTIINYLLKGGTALKTSWIKKYSVSISSITNSFSTTEITSELNELFWKLLLNYTAYNGNVVVFRDRFESALAKHLSHIAKTHKNQLNPLLHGLKKTNADQKNTAYGILTKGDLSSYEIEKKISDIQNLNTFLEEIKNEIENNTRETSMIPDKLIFETIPTEERNKIIALDDRLFNNEHLEEWCSLIICQKQIPTALRFPETYEIKELLNQIIIYHSQRFFKIIQQKLIPEAQLDWLSHSINFGNLCTAISQFNPNRESYLRILEKFYTALGTMNFNGISSKEMQNLLSRKLINAVANDNWRILSIENIWNELLWDVCTKKRVDKKSFLAAIEKQITQLPSSLQLSFKALLNVEKQIVQKSKEDRIVSKIHENQTVKNIKSFKKESIAVRNAGIVLLNSYIVMLLERLNLVSNNEFTSTENQITAVQYLQYVVTGLSKTEETYLPLNKVLCGLPLTDAVPDEIEISEDKKQLINGLIAAAISHWSVIGECSVDGFRGNWLVRDGLLLEWEDKWELTVDKRAYDVLINKSPFAFSIIKYPWMNKPLHVTWPY